MGEKGHEELHELGSALPARARALRIMTSTRGAAVAIAAVAVLGVGLLVARNASSGDDTTKTATAGTALSTASTASSASSASSSAAAARTHPAPDPASLQRGAILFKGDSGDNIGFIAQDGLSRFLSLTGPGVSKGDAAGRAIAVAWDKGPGKITSFGANLHTTTNRGRYGVNPFRNISATGATTGATAELYLHGCAIEVGQTSCQADHDGGPIVNGDQLTIIIGEEGHLDATGDYSIDWWFVFQPN